MIDLFYDLGQLLFHVDRSFVVVIGLVLLLVCVLSTTW